MRLPIKLLSLCTTSDVALKLFAFFVALSIFIFAPYASARPYDQGSNTQQQKSPATILLETDMLEARYLASPKDEIKKALVFNYESLMPTHCISSEEKPQYISEQCQAIIDKALNFDPKNLRAICFKDGFSSEECKTLSQNVAEATQQSPYEQLKKMLDAPPRHPISPNREALDPERRQVQVISDQLLRGLLDFKQEETPVKKQNLLRIYTKLLPLVCKMKPNEPYTPVPECISHTEQSLILDRTFKPALCFKHGPTSPYCSGVVNTPWSQKSPSGSQQSDKGFIEF